ncbi:hypothetical protein [Spirillospora sp. NPDC029432]|uniref:hypothetical protein n=1 Tax=Spirillospora sp. NPDC029432 TaxID=3154599 RepID=UPI0034531FDC
MRRSLLVAGVAAGIMITGCAADPPPRKTANASAAERFAGYAGVVNETGNFLAVAVLDGKARAFVCDEQDEAWFEGSVAKEGMVTLLAAKDRKPAGFFNTLQGEGTFWIEGRLRTFKAAPVDRTAGLYRAQSANGQLVAGWVLLPNGDQVGVATRNGVNQPAPPIKPGQGTVTIGGEQVPLKSGLQQLSSGG